jgi:cation/acetate symporter
VSIQIWTLIIVGITFALYVLIAIWSRAQSTTDFYIAGRHVHPIANGMATAADWMSAASFISMAGLISFMGYDGTQYLLGWTGGYVLLALLIAPYLRKFGQYTVPDFIGARYYSDTARVVAVVCAIFVSFTYVVGQMKGVGIAFSRFLEVDFQIGVIIGVAIVFFYAVLGGMKGITYTQVAQYCVLIFAFTIPAVFISIYMVNHPVPQLGFGSYLPDGTAMLDKLDQLHTDLGFKEYTVAKKPMIDLVFVTGALMLGTAGLPHVIVRFFTVPKVSDARKSVGWALVFIAILYTTAPAVAVFARTNLINTVHNQSYEGLPEWFANWETTGLLQYDDKNADGRIQYYNEDNQDFQSAVAGPSGWRGNELTIDQDIMVLANPEIAQLPGWVVALVVAGGLAAALSTAAGLLLVISTAVSHDIFKKIIKPDITDKQELVAARAAIGVSVVVAGYFGMNPPDYVAAIVAFAFGLAASSFFPAILLGIFDKRTNMTGAVSGMVIGICFTAAYIWYFKFGPGDGHPEQYLWNISPEGIGTLGMVINFIVTLVVSRMTRAPSESIRQLVEEIRVPRTD